MDNYLKIKLKSNGIMYTKEDFKTEVHFLGQIVGASNIEEDEGIFCDINFEAGNGTDWGILSPNSSIQTQTAYKSYGNSVIFSHPFDIAYGCNSIFGWPKIICRVWKFNDTSKIDLMAYGVTTLPNTTGYHEIEFNTWILQGSISTEILGFYLGTKPKMNTSDPICYNLSGREELLTKPGPVIHVACDVLLKNFYFHSISGQN